MMTGKKAILGLFESFGNTDTKRMAIYLEYLNDFPQELVIKACQKATLECKFLPSIAELVQAIKSLIGDINPDIRTKTWAEAWSEIEKNMYKYGCAPNKSGMKFSTKEIEETVMSMGGIDEFANCSPSNMGTLRAQTREVYKNICQRHSELQTNSFVLGIDKTQIEAPKQDKKFLLTGEGQIIF